MGCGCESVKHVVQGAAKLVQSAAGVGLADEATIEQRRAICRACEYAVPCHANPKRYCKCDRCGWLAQAQDAAG
ncbi:hypothetical protein ACERK3_07170 [Phycisphaerales bacterium AB-hyl4]|uniref:Uncharacterized protein n=1 Tax=Natronomicrosphaera hydrolytica TaxID=3242702 RepID=A0ABV4U5Q1_9BACT